MGDMAERISKMQACTQNRVLNFSVVFNGNFRADMGVLAWTGDGSEIKLSLRINRLKDATVYWADPGCWGENFISFVYSACVEMVPTVNVNSIENGVVLNHGVGKNSYTFQFHSRNTDRLIVSKPFVRSTYRVGSVDVLIARVSALLEELRA